MSTPLPFEEAAAGRMAGLCRYLSARVIYVCACGVTYTCVCLCEHLIMWRWHLHACVCVFTCTVCERCHVFISVGSCCIPTGMPVCVDMCMRVCAYMWAPVCADKGEGCVQKAVCLAALKVSVWAHLSVGSPCPVLQETRGLRRFQRHLKVPCYPHLSALQV